MRQLEVGAALLILLSGPQRRRDACKSGDNSLVCIRASSSISMPPTRDLSILYWREAVRGSMLRRLEGVR